MVLYPPKPKDLPPTCRSCLYYGSLDRACYEPRNVSGWDVVADQPIKKLDIYYLRSNALPEHIDAVTERCGYEGKWYKSHSEYIKSQDTFAPAKDAILKQETPAQLLARLKRIKVGDI